MTRVLRIRLRMERKMRLHACLSCFDSSMRWAYVRKVEMKRGFA
jgi:hypothetical protein